ncbi:MAG: alpha/beta hydrolase [Leptolyngbyaceae cyanobacterium bins.59]|nr:alpha/beta hydrolase [Leptolyngbyaceae cyanobacterium bins.59]
MSVISSLLTVSPTLAAERIYVSFGILERSIPIESLEVYARTGVIRDDLAAYTDYADPKQLEQLRGALLNRIQLSPVAISQFLYTPIGENLLARLGEVIRSDSGQSGFYAIRSALILAAADKENGLTLLNVLRKFPNPGIRVDVSRALDVVGSVERLVTQTNRAVAAVDQQARAEASVVQSVDADELPDLRNRGPLPWGKQTITLFDLRRNRFYPVDMYLPQGRPSQRQFQPPYPVIVLSHGIGSDRTTLAYLAQQYASYGFAAAVVEHLGSNAQQIQALINGTAADVSKPTEFIDRPLDIKFLLDELTRLSRPGGTFPGLLNLDQVGVIGQSFGGYTALALVSPEVNFQPLQEQCPPGQDSFNLSLFLQCLVTRLPETRYDLYDPRIKATIALNPVSSSVLGEFSLSRIRVPVMIVAGSADTVTPALFEQIRPFTWLTGIDRYLASINNGTHFSVIGDSGTGNEPVPIPEGVLGPNPTIARRYMNALTLAFFSHYVAKRPGYRNYLTASYARSISQEPLRLSLTQAFSAAQLNQALEGRTPPPNPLPTLTLPATP